MSLENITKQERKPCKNACTLDCTKLCIIYDPIDVPEQSSQIPETGYKPVSQPYEPKS